MVQKKSKMNVLVLMKRFGANKDMVSEDFGRQIRLFENLLGNHEIDFFVPDYKKSERKDIRLHGMTLYVRPYSLFSHFAFISELKKLIQKKKYDFIVGSSDPLLGIMAYWVGKRCQIKSVYDMQDEYSCYFSYKIPFVKYFDKKAVQNSDVVITVSDSLNKLVKSFRGKTVITIQNGIEENPKIVGKNAARKKLGLPIGKIIVYVGELSKFKGVDTLIDAFIEIRKLIPSSYLLLSGPIIDVNVKQEGVIYKKLPKREDVFAALCASDVAVLPNPRNKFSQYCFPYKLVEYMTANLPIVATNGGDSSLILKDYGLLCEPQDKFDMAQKIIFALKENKRISYLKQLKELSWVALSGKLERALGKNG